MKVNTLQIMWHNKQPVFSVDFNRHGELATAGADKEIRLWRVVDKEAEEGSGEETGSDVEYLCNLSAHSRTVNVVRFSPDGNAIASAGDSGEVVMWRKHSLHKPRMAVIKRRLNAPPASDAAAAPPSSAAGTSDRQAPPGEPATKPFPAPAAEEGPKPAAGEQEHKEKEKAAEGGGAPQRVSAGASPATPATPAIPATPATPATPASTGGPGSTKKAASSSNSFSFGGGDTAEGKWKAVGMLRGQTDDVQDLAWSPDSTAVVTGSIENVAFLWDAESNRALSRLDGHHHYIQGVCWDPLGDYIITQSGDRSCRVYAPKPPKAPKRKRKSAEAAPAAEQGTVEGQASAPAPAQTPAQAASSVSPPPAKKKKEISLAGRIAKQGGVSIKGVLQKKFFHDETLPSFFRRLSFSPDGTFVACPAGRRENVEGGGHCVHIFKRGHWAKPAVTIPALSKAVVAVKFCPVLFQHPREDPNANAIWKPKTKFDLPYRVYFAVVTVDSVILYETGSAKAVALISGLHCASLTDLAWSPDGRRMAISSHDGYCSLVRFADGELGTPWEKPLTPAPTPTPAPTMAPAPLEKKEEKEEAQVAKPPQTLPRRVVPQPLEKKSEGPPVEKVQAAV